MKETESMSTYKKICNKILKKYHMILILMLPGCSSMYNYHASQSATRIEQASCHNKKLPKDLLYNNKPIPDACMKRLTADLFQFKWPHEIDLDTFIPQQDNAGRGMHQWEYIGTLPHGSHLIYAYLSPQDGTRKSSSIHIISRIGNILKVADHNIIGYDAGPTMILEKSSTLRKNTLTYCQVMADFLLYYLIIEQYPELEKELQNKQLKGLSCGSPSYIGYGTLEVTITAQDEFKNKRLISFTPAVDDDFDAQNWLKNTPKASLGLKDAIRGVIGVYASQHAHKPLTMEQLKEIMLEAITYIAEKEKEEE
ncbi:MAG: hypothetical protein WC707_06310 [Candidatus Babeliaceae bacterium]|jgi:hypothetical protein